MESTEIILNKAEKLFADSGFGSVSMTSIANACKMSKANLYHHFSSKEDLYTQILIRAQKNTQNILEKTKKIYAIKLDIPWSDLGSWSEISRIFI